VNWEASRCDLSCSGIRCVWRMPEATAARDTNFKRMRPANWLEKMKLRMTKKLKFWVDVACEQRKPRTSPKGRHALVSEVLHEFEQAGDAMRYLRADGKIGWKPTQWMLDRLADAEREAVEDAEHDLP
jgi:hypothetical protein